MTPAAASSSIRSATASRSRVSGRRSSRRRTRAGGRPGSEAPHGESMDIPSSAELGEATAAFDSAWGGVDEVLYGLCQRFPGHSDRRAVMAKSRAHRSGLPGRLERCISPPPGEQAVVVAGDYLFGHARDADEIVDSLEGIREPLTAPAMRRVVELHGQLTTLLRAAPGCNRAPRSFVSKYLHFQQPGGADLRLVRGDRVGETRSMARWAFAVRAAPRQRRRVLRLLLAALRPLRRVPRGWGAGDRQGARCVALEGAGTGGWVIRRRSGPRRGRQPARAGVPPTSPA